MLLITHWIVSWIAALLCEQIHGPDPEQALTHIPVGAVQEPARAWLPFRALLSEHSCSLLAACLPHARHILLPPLLQTELPSSGRVSLAGLLWKLLNSASRSCLLPHPDYVRVLNAALGPGPYAVGTPQGCCTCALGSFCLFLEHFSHLCPSGGGQG